MTNRYQPHVLLLPEDDANAQIINGFLLENPVSNRVQVLPEAGGWSAVIDRFCHNEVPAMNRYTERYMILVLDFDGDPSRLNKVKAKVPINLSDRVFVFGVKSEPEELKRALGSHFETLGSELARDCRKDCQGIWRHPLLVDNAEELVRFRASGAFEVLVA